MILTAKYFIFTIRKQNEDLFFLKFLHTLKIKLGIDKKVFNQKGKTEVFEERFGLLHEFV